jgi:sec-independent protein translocase protein TatA
MPYGLTPLHLLIALVVVLFLFGPSRLPALGESLGRSLSGFRSGFREESPAATRSTDGGDVTSEQQDPS